MTVQQETSLALWLGWDCRVERQRDGRRILMWQPPGSQNYNYSGPPPLGPEYVKVLEANLSLEERYAYDRMIARAAAKTELTPTVRIKVAVLCEVLRIAGT